jgi:hypothetical protein
MEESSRELARWTYIIAHVSAPSFTPPSAVLPGGKRQTQLAANAAHVRWTSDPRNCKTSRFRNTPTCRYHEAQTLTILSWWQSVLQIKQGCRAS